MEMANDDAFWSWSSRGWLHWEIQVWLHTSSKGSAAMHSISWRLWVLFLCCHNHCQNYWGRRWCYFTAISFSTSKLFCTAKHHQRPCYYTYSAWERVDALCLQTFLVLTDKRGRSIWVDSLQAGPYGRVLYVLLYFASCLQLSFYIWFLWVVTLKPDGRLLLVCHPVLRR